MFNQSVENGSTIRTRISQNTAGYGLGKWIAAGNWRPTTKGCLPKRSVKKMGRISQELNPVNSGNAISLTDIISLPGGDLKFTGSVAVDSLKNGSVQLQTPHIITFSNVFPGSGNLTIEGKDIRGKKISETKDNSQLSYSTTNHFSVIDRIFIDGPGESTFISAGLNGNVSSKFFVSAPINGDSSFNPGIFIAPANSPDFTYTVFHTPDAIENLNLDISDFAEYPHEFLVNKNGNEAIGEHDGSYSNKSSFHRIVITNFVSGKATCTYVV